MAARRHARTELARGAPASVLLTRQPRPRCRRHELKARHLVRTTLHPDGPVSVTMLAGTLL
ncbi:MAG: hypothetical protein QOE19_2835, partial [Actinomycetota bacterium]|nr:hypothetical protein [Actinomycetota bacterium]